MTQNTAQRATTEATEQFMKALRERNPHETEFHQAVHEVVESVMPWYLDHSQYQKANVLERLTEPDRIISFRVAWENDAGDVEVNKAWRVQFNHLLGPYKGGLRFHPSVNQSVLKFLGFEQILKNSLTGLPMGGGKGGSNFDPKGKSDREVMRFCQALMTELSRHIGEDIDIPAGDIGVGAREIGFLFGQYVRVQNRWAGVMTGKRPEVGGSALRPEATGYGTVYFANEMLAHHGDSLEGKRIAISGSGNVSLYAAEKALDLGAEVVTLSDSNGLLHAPKGLNAEQLAAIHDLKEVQRGRLSELKGKWNGVDYHGDQNPWSVECEVAMPCATQNELDEDDAKALIGSGVLAISEGANMPTTAAAASAFANAKVLHAPGKASNAGGVAVSGLEQSQNALRLSWTREEVDQRLQGIMRGIHSQCVEMGTSNASGKTTVSYVDGANVAGFKKVADAMLAAGIG